MLSLPTSFWLYLGGGREVVNAKQVKKKKRIQEDSQQGFQLVWENQIAKIGCHFLSVRLLVLKENKQKSNHWYPA